MQMAKEAIRDHNRLSVAFCCIKADEILMTLHREQRRELEGYAKIFGNIHIPEHLNAHILEKLKPQGITRARHGLLEFQEFLRFPNTIGRANGSYTPLAYVNFDYGDVLAPKSRAMGPAPSAPWHGLKPTQRCC